MGRIRSKEMSALCGYDRNGMRERRVARMCETTVTGSSEGLNYSHFDREGGSRNRCIMIKITPFL